MVRWLSLERPVLVAGLICSLLYFFYFGYALLLAVFAAKAETQVAVAFVSFPTSAVFLSWLNSLLDWLGPYGSPPRRAGEWLFLGVAGGLQYFVVGVVFAIIIRGIRSGGD